MFKWYSYKKDIRLLVLSAWFLVQDWSSKQELSKCIIKLGLKKQHKTPLNMHVAINLFPEDHQ